MRYFRLPFFFFLILLLLNSCFSPSVAPASSLENCCGVLLVKQQQSGSAAIISADGLVLSAYHMVKGNEAQLSWYSAKLGRQPLKVVAVDPAHDLALLQLSTKLDSLKHLELASAEPAPGEQAWLYGHPMMRRDYLIPGIWGMSESQFIYLPDLKIFAALRPVCASAVPGFSGGPWVNSKGEICAVQSAIITMNKASVGLSHAAPLESIRKLLASRNSTKTADLGLVVHSLYEVTPAERQKLAGKTLDGAVVSAVLEGSPCLGLLKSGDVITAVNAEQVHSSSELLARIRQSAPGHKFKISLLRAAKELEVEIASSTL